MVSPSAVILHRRLLEEHGGFDEDLPGRGRLRPLAAPELAL